MLDNLLVIDKDKIFEEAQALRLQEYRFMTFSCVQQGEQFELTYHFDLNYKMKHLRILIEASDKIKSISNIYPAAFLIENEYQDLYGFEFTDLIVDYKGHLYLSKSAKKTPWLNTKGE